MAGAFSRCGQTTLGLSPALAGRLACVPPPATHGADTAQLVDALPLLYRTVERVRRRVAAAFSAPLGSLRLSDATLTRLQPVDAGTADAECGASGEDERRRGAAAAVTASGSLDVGLLRDDRFCYWRPHVDQVSVAEYEFSALLYLTSHGASAVDGAGATPECAHAAGAPVDVADRTVASGSMAEKPADASGSASDFEGGLLVFHDADADRIVQPEPGLLVAFTSGTANLHAVQRVTSGSRFALTMWFSTQTEAAHVAAVADPTHVAMQRWAAGLPDPLPDPLPACQPATLPPHTASAEASPLPCPLAVPSSRLPTRDEALVSAALCSLPANDPLGRALLLAASGQHSEALARGVGLPAHCAHAAPIPLALPSGRDEDTTSVLLADPAEASHALLQPRVTALDALLTTLRRARAARVPRLAQVAPPADDAFSVFD